MIEEVISSIIDAENKARDMVLEAEKRGEQILLETEKQIEDNRHSEEKSNKQYFSEQMQLADQEADALKTKQIEIYKKQVDEQIAASKKKVDAAVKFILENVR